MKRSCKNFGLPVKPSFVTLGGEYSESIDFVGAKHLCQSYWVSEQKVYTRMLRPFSFLEVTKEGLTGKPKFLQERFIHFRYFNGG
jgi:hypothetical protein